MTVNRMDVPSPELPYRHRMYGLEVASQIDLHARRPGSSADTDVRVELGDPVSVPGEAPTGELQVQWSTVDGLRASFVREPAGGHRLRFESTCEITVDASASELSLQMNEGVDIAMGSVLVAGTVMSYVLMLRDDPVLHASAVEVEGRAIAFVGSSGMGKTTLATLLCRAGGNLVTDDVLRLARLDGGGFGCWLGATELRLRQAAAGLAASFGESGSERITADARHALSVPIAMQEKSRLTAVVIPRPRRDLDQVALTRLEPRDAVFALLRFPRIVGICAPLLQSREFLRMTEVARSVPIFIADVPWGPPFAEDLPRRLLGVIDDAVAGSYPG